jgi:ring-1,2-phenylacetyl-CoA epoxidase subunit PaaE
VVSADPDIATRAGLVAPHSRGAARFNPLRVSQIEHITGDAVAITFDVPEELRDEYQFIAGQHVALRCTIAGDEVRRNYSICAAATSGVLRVGVKRLPGGVFSGYACDHLAIGDTLEVLTPSGRFYTPLDAAHRKHYAAIVAGSGITPVLALIATTLELEPHSRFTLLYVNKSVRSVMFLEELEDLRDHYLTRLDILYLLDEEQQDVALLSGTLDTERLSRILDLLIPVDSVNEWFLCGPQGLTDMTLAALADRGAETDHVHRELFAASSPPTGNQALTPSEKSAPVGAKVTARLDGRSSTFVTSGGETLLAAVLAVRADAPYACRSGVCGTCRMKVIEGSVDMAQNYALERADIADGYALACQSRPTSPLLVIDFDG